MKEKLLALLVAKFAGVPEATLERIASKKAGSVSDESQLQSIADGIDFAQVLQSEVDSRITDANKKSSSELRNPARSGKWASLFRRIQTPSTTPPANPNDLAAIVAQAIAPLAQKSWKPLKRLKQPKLTYRVQGLNSKRKGFPKVLLELST